MSYMCRRKDLLPHIFYVRFFHFLLQFILSVDENRDFNYNVIPHAPCLVAHLSGIVLLAVCLEAGPFVSVWDHGSIIVI